MFGDDEVDTIIDGAFDVLAKVGIHIGSSRVLKIIGEQDDARVQGDRALMGRNLVESCIKTAPSEIRIFTDFSSEPVGPPRPCG
jgi:trimethylamine:corrinoid methyltransferase-like protein